MIAMPPPLPIIDARESFLVVYHEELEDVRRDAVARTEYTSQDWSQVVSASLIEILSEYGLDNWDGEGAVGVSSSAAERVRKVAQNLNFLVPPGTPPPEVSPSHDGEIVLSWIKTSRRLFSLSIGSHENINYAGRIREGFEPHDVARVSTEDPTPLVQMASLITQLYDGETAGTSLRD